jgi:hypothetical protein
MMYLIRRHILGRNFFPTPDCVHRVPESVRRYHPSASERPMRRSSGSTITMASYPGGAPKLSMTRARDASTTSARLREPAPRRHMRRPDQPVDRALHSHLLPERRVRDSGNCLPLLRVKAKRSCSPGELRELCVGAGLTSCLNPRCIVVVRLFILVARTLTRSRSLRPMSGSTALNSPTIANRP